MRNHPSDASQSPLAGAVSDRRHFSGTENVGSGTGSLPPIVDEPEDEGGPSHRLEAFAGPRIQCTAPRDEVTCATENHGDGLQSHPTAEMSSDSMHIIGAEVGGLLGVPAELEAAEEIVEAALKAFAAQVLLQRPSSAQLASETAEER